MVDSLQTGLIKAHRVKQRLLRHFPGGGVRIFHFRRAVDQVFASGPSISGPK
jgi:hypothetical protein